MKTNLIAGGAPAGIKMPTPELGCRAKSTNINTTTMQGKSKTTPSGMDMLELPFNLSGLLKKASREVFLGFDLLSSIWGSSGAVGIRFHTLCTKPIVMSMFARL